jgi:hypothetical protein
MNDISTLLIAMAFLVTGCVGLAIPFLTRRHPNTDGLHFIDEEEARGKKKNFSEFADDLATTVRSIELTDGVYEEIMRRRKARRSES